MTTTVESLKNEISDCYIKDLKNQLGWFKSIAVLPIQKPIKNILIGKGELPEKFDEVKEFGWRKDIINFVSPNIANQIFEFMKSKRLEIENRKTESELIQLKNVILGLTPKDDDTNQHQETTESENGAEDLTEEGDSTHEQNGYADVSSQETQESEGVDGITAGVETAVIGGASTLALEKIAAKNAKAIEQLSAPKLKSTIESVINVTEKKRNALEHRLTTKQLKNADKYIEKLKANIDNIDGETVNLLKDWNKLGDKFKISRVILEQCGLTEKQLSDIADIANDLAKKPKHEIKTILESKGIKSIDDSIIEALCKAEKPEEIKMMTQILKHGNRIPRMLQTLAGALLVDVAFSGLDVWMYIEQKKEAEIISKTNELRGKNKSKQAKRQLGIGFSSIALEGLAIWLMGSAAIGGPIGVAVGLGVGALTMAASFGIDSLYFDVADFYLQDQEDFLRQKRSQLKQVILQGIYNKKQGDKSFNEHVTSFLSPSLKPCSEKKEKSLNDACASMIFLEEIDKDGQFAYNGLLWDYIKSNKSKEDFLSDKYKNYKEEFEQIWKQMENRINMRMQYVKDEFKKSDIIESIKKGTGMQDLTKIFTNSRAFAELKERNHWDDSKSFNENLQDYKTKLLSEFPTKKVKEFEDLRKSNPSLFLEIISTVSLDAFIDDEDETNDNYNQNVKLVVAYKERLQLTEKPEDKRYLYIDEVKNSNFIENLLKSDFDLSKTEYSTIGKETLIDMVNSNYERNGSLDISDNPMQNVLYRLARELFGYSGENDIQGLMGFFSEGNDSNHGIYYSSKRKINKDGAIDTKFVTNILEKLHERDIDRYVDAFIKSNFYTANYDKNGNLIGYTQKSSIDTPTESIDYKLNEELINKIQGIVRAELMNHTVENQERIKNQISDFVKQHSNGKYLELPYFLILEAKKAGLGDLQRQFFKRENNKMEICYLPSEINQVSLFDDTEKSYISHARESFTEEEQYYIDRVEFACKKIENLRSVPGITLTGLSFEDELDIPIEIEHLISEKFNEREKFKQNMLMYDENVASSSSEKYNEFATYFENMYKGILMLLSGFKLSNDIDGFSLFSQSLYYGNKDIFDESGKIIPIEGDKLSNDTEFKKFYNEQIKTLKIGSKNIKDLWKSDNSQDKELAKQVSNMIYTTVLETCLIKFDKSGNVIGISTGGSNYYESEQRHGVAYGGVGYSDDARNVMEKRKFHKDDIIKNLTNRFKKIEGEHIIDESKIKKILKPQKINKIGKQQKEITDITPDIQKEIESSMEDIDWRYKRGQIRFDVNTSTLKSWDNEVKIIITRDRNIKTIQLDDLDTKLSLKEGLRLANFRNWARKKYKGKKIEVGKGKHVVGKNTLVVDANSSDWFWTRIIIRESLDKYLPTFNSDEGREKIAKWLTKQVS